MDIDSRTLSRGSRVRVAGQLLTGGPTLRLAPVWTDPSEQREAVDSMAVDLVGWHGAVPTSGARVAGTWNGTAVDVAAVEPVELDFVSFRLASSHREQLDLALPVLDRPSSPEDTASANDVIGSLIDVGAVLHFVRVRSGNGVAVVVNAVDPAQVERALRPMLQDALVVVPSRWSRADLDAVDQILSDEEEPAGLFMSGEGMDSQGRYRVTAWVQHITPRLAARLAPYPEGIVALDVWLEPTQSVA
ncbi:hypothetical protein [Rathayibacter sp. VKM Ac-2754]|uniref:hypothetical protein n=1 Tax=Rathayibacter sp. VKM Ac-2754 TaxID=2609251 RepID=UPI001358B5AD|nr:hypothetical protein [Rathayibacter sp. VKM Ac-2754]MWV60339.1 hypothetical protein [Rathayibacter sp. VKM Ac-2754]